jgi:hypothetical protein
MKTSDPCSRAWYGPGMKKTKLESIRKLNLKSDTIKMLKAAELAQAVGGVTIGMGCHQPTTTVLPTGPC